MTKLNQDAIDNLRNNQQQLDQDGVMVGVSRQALDEVLAHIDAQRDEMVEWINAMMNMVEGDGTPPNWDELREFRESLRALKSTQRSSK